MDLEKDMYAFIGCIGLIFANSILGFAPQILFVGLTALQGSMMIQEFKVNKWRRIFKNLGLYNSEKQIPQLIRKEKNDLGERFIFSLPIGICLSDVEKMQEDLETVLHAPIKLELTNNYKLMIQIFDMEYKELYKPNRGVYSNEISDRSNNNSDR